MICGSLSLTQIVESQEGYSLLLPNWFVFTPWGLAGFLLFLVAALAESNRSPFDLPEGESEIIAGYYTEYSGFKFALFFLGEYIGMFAVSGLATTLFLGGWHGPFLPGPVWFLLKVYALIFMMMWFRWTFPRVRFDQLINFAWKILIPLAFANLLITALVMKLR